MLGDHILTGTEAADGLLMKYFGEPDHATTGWESAVLATHRFIRDSEPPSLEVI